MAAAILSIDVGTSRVRARLYDVSGEAVAESWRPTATESPFAGAVELDCETLWQDVAMTAADVSRDAEVVAIGMTAQLGVVFLDADDRVVDKAQTWADTRAREEAEELDCALGRVSYETSGRRMAPELVAPRLHWLRRRRPRQFERVRKIASIKDFLVGRLTGAFVIDETHASYTGLFDVRDRCWSPALMRRLECDPTLFPPVRAAETRAGLTVAPAASLFGVRLGVPVAVGAPDGTAGTIGAGAVRPGVTVDVAGTTDVLLHSVATPVEDPDRRIVLNAHAARGTWSVGGPTGMTGGAVAWALRLLGVAGAAEGDRALAQALAEVGPGCDGLVFRPSLTGSRFPHWNAGERGVLSGIEPGHGAAHVLRAAQEGAAFVVADALDVIRECGAEVTEIVVVGGLSKDRAAVQLRADILETPIVVLKSEEASSAGIAMLAGVAANVCADLSAASKAFVKLRERFEPEPELFPQLRQARARWIRAQTMI